MDLKYLNAYEQLGLQQPGVSWDQVRTNYRRKVQRLHPDRVQQGAAVDSDQEEFIRVTQAYKILNEYHRLNNELPQEYEVDSDPVMQVDLGNIEPFAQQKIVNAIDSVQRTQPQGSTNTLKMTMLLCSLVLSVALGFMAFASWQKNQVPPVTPFTSEKPMPLSGSAAK